MNHELEWDKLLKIKSSGRDDSRADQFRYPYEPTNYPVLERLANSGYIGKKDLLLDYGCGKGRVGFFLSYQTRCRSVGIEYDERIYDAAIANLKTAVSARRCQILLANAESYEISPEVSRCFFFNPFSVEILKKVLARIYEGRAKQWEMEDAEEREMLLFFYYPSDEYVAHLMTEANLMFVDEIDCMDLFDNEDEREKILIFEVM